MSEIILSNNTAFLAKAQSARGAAAAYTNADVVIATGKPSIKIDYTTVDANLATVERGGNRKKFAYKKGTLELTVDLGIGGSNETPLPGALPQYDALLRACGLQRLNSILFTTGTLDSGSRDTLFLDGSGSSTDDFYCGHSISAKVLLGNTQAPGSTANNIVKIAHSTQITGTAGGGSTTTAIALAASASLNDDDYVGQEIKIGAETRTISAYVGSTQIATVSLAFTGTPAGEIYSILLNDDGLAGYVFGITHFSGTIIDAGSKNSTNNIIYLPTSVGSANFSGCYLEITTGANDPENIRISAYDTVNKKATLNSSLAVNPTNTSTFKIKEKRAIKSFVAATSVCTLSSNLVIASVSGNAYTIEQSRVIVSYEGAAKKAKVSPSFSRNIGAAEYTINPYVMYTALPTKAGETLITVATYEDGTFYEFIDCQGTAVINANSNESLSLKITLQGSVSVYEDMDLPEENISRYVPSLVVSSTNEPQVIIAGYGNAVVHGFEFDLGNDVQYRDIDNRAYITDHKPMIKSKIDKPYKADWDYELLMRESSKLRTVFALGDMGNQVVLFLEGSQIIGAADSETNGITTVDLELQVTTGIKRIVLN